MHTTHTLHVTVSSDVLGQWLCSLHGQRHQVQNWWNAEKTRLDAQEAQLKRSRRSKDFDADDLAGILQGHFGAPSAADAEQQYKIQMNEDKLECCEDIAHALSEQCRK